MALTDFFATEIATELIKMIFEIWGKLYHCKSNAKQFKCLIEEFLPIIEEIKNSGIELPADRRSQLNQFSETLKYGVELAHKVIDCSPCTVCKRLRLAGELEKLEKNVSRFVSGPMQAHIWADVHHIKYQVEQRFDRLEERLEQLKNGGVAFNSGKKKIEEQVDLISPQQEKKGNDKKAKEPPVTTEVLKVALHCQVCIDNIRKLVVETKGVHDCSMDKEKVEVKWGLYHPFHVYKRAQSQLKKKVEVMPPKKEKEEEKVEVEVMPPKKEEEKVEVMPPKKEEEKVEVEVMPPKKEEEKEEVEVEVMPKKEEEKVEVEVMPPKKEEVEVMPPKKVEVEWGPCHPFHVYNIAQSQLKNFEI
ncbi:Heavy metal-associated isoprenylated plant protein [Quillaja saponaria]|uniref:Heavy metal-associated isoprenylated plant protein n=1 Tax=Quillaja saponaria TaxID=32244 RepID=A0AAD7PK86_QUISA|nr:Heavy metal-associated isoprenylated plant protein [Quillaja saponaria]